MNPAFHLQVLTVNGVELAYIERGTGDPVILVHGGGATDLRTWAAQIDDFSASYRVIAYSQRYHWPNAWVGDGSDVYSTSRHVADLAELILGLHLGPCHLVGSSYGADIVLLLAYKHPELVRSLVLGEPGLHPWLMTLPGGDALHEAYLRAIEPAAQAALHGDAEAAARTFIEVVLGPGLYDQLPEATRSRVRDNARLLGYERPDRDDTPLSCSAVAQVAAPTLLLTGDGSPAMFGLVADALARCMPGAERAVVPDTAHILHGMNPAAYNNMVLAFLARH